LAVENLNVFKFDTLATSKDGQEITASCMINPDAAFFKGHFDSMSIMPAIAQLLMVEALIKNSRWDNHISSVQSCKFFDLIQPGQRVQILLTQTGADKINFKIEKDNRIFTRGIVLLPGNTSV
jgi:3-hydroxymyristoyl/3-hydroxydecanoyl-(acyl carrier protein) dehydratase